jgi:hypothetical protein
MWRHPKNWKWSWLSFQVLSPLVGPIAVSLIAWLLLTTTDNVPLSWKVIADVTPWALIFFTMALLGGAFHDIWPNMGSHQILFGFLIAETIVVFMYIEQNVSWRLQHPGVEPGQGVWVAAFIMLGASVLTCHEAAA